MARDRTRSILLAFIVLTAIGRTGRGHGAESAAPLVRILAAEDRRAGGAPLQSLAGDPNPEVRARVAEALGRIGNPSGVPGLAALLLDPEPRVRRAAAFALGQVDDSAAAVALAARLTGSGGPHETDEPTRALCVESLGRLARGAEACRRALLDPDARVLEAALRAAWRIPGTAPLDHALRAADHPDTAVRRAAAYCLMRLCGPRPVGRTPAPAPRLAEADRLRARIGLLGLSRAGDAAARIHAVRGLGAFADDSTAARLLALRGDADWRVRVEVVRALSRPDRPPRVRDLRPLLEDPNPNVRAAAVEACAVAGPEAEATGKLRSLLRDRRPRIRQVAFLAYLERLKRQGDPLPGPAVDAIEEATRNLLEQKDWSLRALAAEGAVLLPIDLALPILERMTTDEPRVARAAVDPLLQRRARMRNDPILAQVGADAQALLSAPDPVLRATVLESLGSILADTTLRPDPSDWLSLESILEQSRRYAVAFDRVPDVRLAVVGVAERFPDRPEMAGLLVDSCEDPEYLVRRAAVAALRAAGRTPPREAEPVEPGRSDFEYAAILSWAQGDHEAVIETAEGTIRVRLLSREAPLTCWNFARLAEQGFYDRSRWHRVVPDFVLQAGCNRGDGYGGSELAVRCEINRQRFDAGVLGMALSGKDTGTSQFFLTHSEQPHLDGRYTAFGVVEEGLEVAGRIEQGANLWSIRVVERSR